MTQAVGTAMSWLGRCCSTQQSPEIAVIQQLWSSMSQQASHMLKAALEKSLSAQNNCTEFSDQKNYYLFLDTWLDYFHIKQLCVNRCIHRCKWIVIRKTFRAWWGFQPQLYILLQWRNLKIFLKKLLFLAVIAYFCREHYEYVLNLQHWIAVFD